MSDLSSYVCSSDLGKPPMGDEYHPEHAVASFLSHVLAGKAANVAVVHLHVPALPHQPLCELRGHDDGAVTSAGASDGNRQIALALALVARQQDVQHSGQPLEEGGEVGVRNDGLDDQRLVAGARPNIVRVMGI